MQPRAGYRLRLRGMQAAGRGQDDNIGGGRRQQVVQGTMARNSILGRSRLKRNGIDVADINQFGVFGMLLNRAKVIR
ncbi:hypothetical protein CS8_029750 [Cupriavidus sp. 8B]